MHRFLAVVHLQSLIADPGLIGRDFQMQSDQFPCIIVTRDMMKERLAY
jgi:hypothetical protein